MALAKFEMVHREEKERINVNCPICNVENEGALCEQHSLLTKDFKWLQNYVNTTKKVDKNTMYILEHAISDRVSRVINDVEIVYGKLMIDDYIKKDITNRLRKFNRCKKCLEEHKDDVDRRAKCNCSYTIERVHVGIRASENVEKTLREILALESAKLTVIKLIKE